MSRRLPAVVVLSLVVCVPAVAEAALITFNNRPAFNLAAPGLPVETFVERLAQELAAGNAPVDDVTLLGVEVLPVASGPPRPTYLPHPGAIQ